MPIQPDPDRPDWRVLVDAEGAEIGAFLHVEREDPQVADLFEPAPDLPLERVVDAILADLGGWRIAGEEPLGEALVAAGGRPVRHAHALTHDLATVPSAPDGFALAALEHSAAQLVPAYLAAYGPDHPDFAARADEDPEEELGKMLGGDTLGRLLECSGVALDGERVVGAIIVTDVPGEPPFGGPWVSELFRDPAHPGTGRALLRRALARAQAAGLPALSLAVTVGNPALRLYESLGFRRVLTALSVDL
jgi:ribosomal protein S18 acetylase RimI-like enzyme